MIFIIQPYYIDIFADGLNVPRNYIQYLIYIIGVRRFLCLYIILHKVTHIFNWLRIEQWLTAPI